MNRMKEIAELFGVELEEEFKISQSQCIYKFTEAGLMFKPYNEWELSYNFFNEVIKSDIVKPVLNRQEKDYLENVLRPFKDKVSYVVKLHKFANIDEEFLFIVFESDSDTSFFNFPVFQKDTMYKGMEVGKEYTLKELGLFNED